MRRALVGLTMISAATLAEAAEIISGPARVVGSDTLAVNGKWIILFGIESVENTQLCYVRGQPWQCYPAAVRQLETLAVGEVACTPTGEPDDFGRVRAVCEAAGVNINDALVRTGFAVANPEETADFIPAEEAARAQRFGFWQGEFMRPREFRETMGAEAGPR